MKARRQRWIRLSFFTVAVSCVFYIFGNGTLIKGAAPSSGPYLESEHSSSVNQPAVSGETTKAETEKSNSASKVQDSSTKNESKKADSTKVYTVKAGQTLWEIAKDTGIPLRSLMIKNQLSSSVIFKGQELVIEK